MQKIIIEKPYKFVPPHRGTWWPSFIQKLDLYGRYLKKSEGIVSYECRHTERLSKSLADGHGILLTPNHCRVGDPLVMGFLARDVKCHVFGMASWHLFNQDWFTAWSIRKMGGFSINREGVDRQAINTAIEILESAERPLIIFPEGAVTRTNDRLHALLDGVAFIARTAAKKRQRHEKRGSVVVHPVGLKYIFRGDLEQAVDEVLSEIEQRLSWRPQRELGLPQRVAKVGMALLALKELEYFNATQSGTLSERLDGLIDRLLHPIEAEWLGATQSGPVVPRIKSLRMKILPEMVEQRVDEEERSRRWRQLADLYLSQQISCYPPDYLVQRATKERYLETIERFEEDLTDDIRVHGSLHVIIDVGEPIEVNASRPPRGQPDPLMAEIQSRLQSQIDQLDQQFAHVMPPIR